MYGNVLQRSRLPRLEADGYDFVLVWTMGLSVLGALRLEVMA